VSWLLLAGLGILWAVFLLPGERGRHSPGSSVEGFERDMELLAVTEQTQGRWIVVPKKGKFIGTHARHRVRARDRRRRVFIFLLESIGLTFLIGLVPPLRVAWDLTMLLGALLVLYVWLLVSLRARERETRPTPHERVQGVATPTGENFADVGRAPVPRYVAQAVGGMPRPVLTGLDSLDPDDDPVHVVVRPRAAQA